ncbi:hypothetical protein Lal_00012535, partial [Lupinus albus]
MVTSMPELHDLHRFSPITPSLQCSDQGKKDAKFRFHSGKYLPSPESANVNMISYHPKYTKSLQNSHLETNKVLETDSYEWQMNQLKTPTCNSIANAPQFTPLSSYPRESMSFTAKTKVWTDIPQSRLCHGSIRHLSSSSLGWQGETQDVNESYESDRSNSKVSTNPVKANWPTPIYNDSKFILKAVPSFTPLTPSTDNKGN